MLDVIVKKIQQLDAGNLALDARSWGQAWTKERAERKDEFKKKIKEIIDNIADDFKE